MQLLSSPNYKLKLINTDYILYSGTLQECFRYLLTEASCMTIDKAIKLYRITK